MSFLRFEELLERTIGLKAATIGTSAIERAVRERQRQCGLADIDAYWQHLLRSRDALQDLIEAVVVPETWFFRDPQAFAAMAGIAVDYCRSGRAPGELRLLSLPCSTGEEPYTMAMALIEAGLPPERFRIDAIDVSSHALAVARQGIYGRNSFRGKDLGYRDRHFEPVERGFRIGDAVRRSVRFVQGNLLDPDLASGGNVYDIVFCRNLLIYFDTDVQDRAVGVLKRLLAPHGTLFAGHSEAGLMIAHNLISAKMPMAFAFRHAVAAACQPASRPAAGPAPARRAVTPAPRTTTRSMPRAQPNPAPAPAPPRERPLVAALPDIAALRLIADRGALTEAAAGCEALIRAHGPTPDAFLLLGLISDARDDAASAAAYYRKALYLEPDHAEALGHLALLLRKQGDVAGALRLTDRLRRNDVRRAR